MSLADPSPLNRPLTRYENQALDLYAARLLDENARAGLMSGGTDRETIYRRHFTESLVLLAMAEGFSLVAHQSSVIDVGSGGGFPGVPMKISRPDLSLTLVEANGKRARFLESLVTELELSGVTVIQARAEDLAREPHQRERHDLVLARAIAPLRVLLELTLPFARVGGALALPKGSGYLREIEEAATALDLLGGKIEQTAPMEVHGPGPRPTLVIVRKELATPDRFPRRPGIPAKRPL